MGEEFYSPPPSALDELTYRIDKGEPGTLGKLYDEVIIQLEKGEEVNPTLSTPCYGR
jgi:hypothetical protein